MSHTVLLRYAVLAVPVALMLAGWAAGVARRGRSHRVDPRREAGAALLAFVAALVGVAVLDRVARPLGWWHYGVAGALFDGLPVDLWLGWAVLWGPVPVLLRRRVPVWLTLGLLFWVDTVTMPALDPVVRLGGHWLLGEALGLLGVAVPAVLLGSWTADRRHLAARASLQVVVFAGLVAWLVPTAAFVLGDGAWATLFDRPRWQLSLVVQVAGVLALPGLAAVREFATRGGGTPYPWDPPIRLVTTGPYAYLANPMQCSMVAMLALLAVSAGSATLLGAMVVTLAFSEAVAEFHERGELRARYGESWRSYRRHVRRWLPRWRPWVPAAATLWTAADCPLCRTVAAGIARLEPRGLRQAAAEHHPERLVRARYDHADGYAVDGVAAVGRALEHVHLGWASAGWALGLPLVGWFAQLLADAAGAGPRQIAHSPAALPSASDRE